MCALVALVAGLISIGHAQNREKFGISAKAGGVNSVAGRVLVKREGQAQQLLSSSDDLAPGDVVTTGADSQAEILLNPGSYFRLGENSEFMLVNNSLNDLLLKLVRGSAIIEATGPDDTGMRIIVATDQKRITIVRSGIYRINVQPGTTDLIVRKGRALIGPEAADRVKGGKRVTFSANDTQIAKIDKHDQDQFDSWSKERGQALARANQKISFRSLHEQLSSVRWRWVYSAANPFGLWTWSALSGCYTFMPFYYGWSSPYGRYYGSYLPIYPGGSYGSGSTLVGNPQTYPPNGPTGGSSGGPGRSGGFGGSPSGPSGPMAPPSQAGPRDPDSGGRRVALPRSDN
jgi:hypothetical protein